MIAFYLHNCTTGIVCAVLCLENIDFALYVLSTNRINCFAGLFSPLFDNKGHSVFSLSFLFFFSPISAVRQHAEHWSATIAGICVGSFQVFFKKKSNLILRPSINSSQYELHMNLYKIMHIHIDTYITLLRKNTGTKLEVTTKY